MSIRQLAAGAALTLLIGTVLSACVSSSPSASPNLVAGSSATQSAGAGKVPASDGTQTAPVVTIAFTPNPPKTGNNTIDALVTDASGQPISDAKVSFDIDMTNMSHGKNVIAAQPAGAGHYTGNLFFMMPGPWRVIVSVAIGGQTSTVRFDFNVK
jgi:hypothetical protein